MRSIYGFVFSVIAECELQLASATTEWGYSEKYPFFNALHLFHLFRPSIIQTRFLKQTYFLPIRLSSSVVS